MTSEQKSQALAYMKEVMNKPLADKPANEVSGLEYADPFDLAVDCCSALSLWDPDYEIPLKLVELAETFFPPIYFE